MTAQAAKSINTVWHNATVTRKRREDKNKHKAVVLWFTGLSGAGKSTLAHAVEEQLFQYGFNTFVLDGDNIRHGLCGDLGFSDIDRKENIRRISETAKLMLEAGVITLTAFISPFRAERALARKLMPQGDCPLAVCEQRDVKGLYLKARKGEIQNFTGISSPYEEPEKPELRIDTSTLSLEQSVQKVIALLQLRNTLPELDNADAL
jgi:adenylylsulfate kinase